MSEEEILKIIIDGGHGLAAQTACSRDAVIAFRATPGDASIDWTVAAKVAETIQGASAQLGELIPKLIKLPAEGG